MAATAPILAKRGICLAQTESTYGTDPTPTGDYTMLVWDLSITVEQDTVSPDYFRPYAGAKHVVAGSKKCSVSFKAALCGAGKSGTDIRSPRISPVLLASKYKLTSTGSPVTARTYTPDTIGMTGVTLKIYAYSASSTTDGNLYEINGFQGHTKLVMDPSSQPFGVWEVEGTGLYVLPITIDPSTITPVYYEQVPPSITGITALIGGDALNIRRFELDNVVTVAEAPAMGPSTTSGYGYFLGDRQQSTIKMTVDAWDEFEFATYAGYALASDLTVAISGIGSVAGNVVSIAASVGGVITSVSEGDADGVKTYDLDMVVKESSGDDEFSIAFT